MTWRFNFRVVSLMLTVFTAVTLPARVSAQTADSLGLKTSPTADSLSQLPDGTSLYARTAIWVDTASRYDVENHPTTSAKQFLSGIKLTQAQLKEVDATRHRSATVRFGFVARRDLSLPPEARQRRYGKFLERLLEWEIVQYRALLTPEQATQFDANVEAYKDSARDSK